MHNTNETVLLHDRKWRTAHRTASARSAVLSLGEGEGRGFPGPSWGVPKSLPQGTPVPSQGTTILSGDPPPPGWDNGNLRVWVDKQSENVNFPGTSYTDTM